MIFNDKSELILNFDSNILIYSAQMSESDFAIYPLSSALASSNSSMKKRLLYVKDLIKKSI